MLTQYYNLSMSTASNESNNSESKSRFSNSQTLVLSNSNGNSLKTSTSDNDINNPVHFQESLSLASDNRKFKRKANEMETVSLEEQQHLGMNSSGTKSFKPYFCSLEAFDTDDFHLILVEDEISHVNKRKKTSNLCTQCDRDVQFPILFPCGHLFCRTCLNKQPNGYFCGPCNKCYKFHELRRIHLHP